MNAVDLWLRLRALFQRARVEKELDEELDFHLAMQRRKHGAMGVSEENAARLARRDFGSIALSKEECRRVRGIHVVEAALQDIRYGLRTLRRSPAFAFTVAATIALGLGLNTALFTFFNAYMLRPLPVRDPYSLYSFTWTSASGHGHAFSWPEYLEFSRSNAAFSESAAVKSIYTRIGGQPVQGQLVTGNYFRMLGIAPQLGRILVPEDAASPGSEPVAVISYAAWQRLFAGRPDIVGSKVWLRGYPMQIVGVAQQGFADLYTSPRDFWAPLTMASRLDEGPDLFGAAQPEQLDIIGRLSPGETVSDATAKLTLWSRRLTAHFPADARAGGVQLTSRATAMPLTPEIVRLFSPLVAAFGLVLLLVCANVANMMLARGMARQREIGVRLSLGAGRGRLIRQLLTESLLLSVPAAMLAFAVSYATLEISLRALYATMPPDLMELIHVAPLGVDWRVFAFMVAAAVSSAFLFGLAPAIQGTRGSVMLAARGEFAQDIRPMRARNLLVVAQVAFCTLLLVTCGALVRATVAMSSFDIGFRTRHVIALNVAGAARDRVVHALVSDAAVDGAASVSSVPLGGLPPRVTVSAASGFAVQSFFNIVSPRFFDILGIPMIEGRTFTDAEAASGGAVAIVSQSAARKLFPGRSAVGGLLRAGGPDAPSIQIVGVVPDIVSWAVEYGKDSAMLYRPADLSRARSSLLVAVRGDVETERRKLEERLSVLAPGAVDDIHSLDQYAAVGVYPFQLASTLGSALGGLALLLTLSGAYGVLSYLVTQRTKEIGIRVALGAAGSNVIGLVVRQSLRLAAIGTAAGGVAALALSHWIASKMVFVRAVDAAAFCGGVSLVVLAALAAAYVPSRRAARIDPIQTLRTE